MARFCLQLNAGIGRNLAMASTKENGGERKSSSNIERVELPENVKTSRILILGGTGRVGGSTALALKKFCPHLRIVIGGRNRDKGAAVVSKLGNSTEFVEVDISDSNSLEKALKGVDLVVHTAGPFQQAEKCTVLEAAIQNKIAYLDVCDDTSYAQRAKSYMNRAMDANVPAITTGGIYPGVSNVMAAELVCAAKSDDNGVPERLRFYYYTAGSGGAGPTILSTSFLLLGEEVVAYNKGEKIKLKPYSGMLNIDFGIGIGKKDVFLLNLPEVRSVHEVLGVPTVSARFGTAPFFWNWGMVAMTYLLPAETLRDRSKVQQLVDLFNPLVRAVDGIAGQRVSMRVDLDYSDGRSRIGIFSHKKLSESVGISTAAFALSILEGSTKPGVWFPEEPEGIAVEARETLLRRAAQGTINFIMNKAPWMVETDPKELGFGIYD
ncbi:Saccharopine dehydrogenase [Perilla frutescens var. hirtella]|nr:Saccharopine dehydrogenase [Perilla frutescens var. hirtella]KAH6810724.1 Saccharopine dehydrogenase [Perilla frutescens var. frutescens]